MPGGGKRKRPREREREMCFWFLNSWFMVLCAFSHWFMILVVRIAHDIGLCLASFMLDFDVVVKTSGRGDSMLMMAMMTMIDDKDEDDTDNDA